MVISGISNLLENVIEAQIMFSELYQHLPTIFGIEDVISPRPRLVGTNQQTSLYSFWAVELDDQIFHSRERLVISVIHTKAWTKGAVLVPDRQEAILSQYQPMYAIELLGWHDPVQEALRGVDIVPDFSSTETQPYDLLRFGLQFRNRVSSGQFGIYVELGRNYSKSLYRLQMVIIETMIDLVDRYDNEEMRLFTQWHRHLLTLPY
jgi:hypothetical protein